MEQPRKSPLDSWAILLGLFALGNLVNGVWMLANPAHWYIHLPANVPGTGPLNEHFVRDIGCIFLLMGLALAIAAFRRSWRLPAMVLTTAFYGAHALVHVYDSARNLFPEGQWKYDLLPVYATPVLLVALTLALFYAERDKAR
jgi:hypothetical protein